MAKRVRPASHWQRKDTPVRLLAQHFKPTLKRDLKEALKHLSSVVPVTRVAQLIRAGRSREIASVIPFAHYREVLKRPFGRLAQLHNAAAKLGVRKINGAFAQKQRAVRFRKMGLAGRTKAQVGRSSSAVNLDELFDVHKSHLKADVEYTDDHGRSPEQCSRCFFFRAPQRCEVVSGIISAEGWCNLFALTSDVAKQVGDVFNFDVFDEETQQALREIQDQLIQQLEQDARDTIDTIITDGTLEGLSADEMAANIRDMISLTDTQAQAVLNYQNMLQELDPAALQRALRDPEYDAALQAAIDSQSDLADAVVNDMVDNYLDNYLDYRAETIARTESTRAANMGLHDAYSQAIDRGALPDDAVKRYWQVAMDEATCEICLSIPDMNPDGVAVDEDFDSSDGPQTDPPDPHPNCRCSVEYVTDLTMVPDTTEEEDTTGAGMYGVGSFGGM